MPSQHRMTDSAGNVIVLGAELGRGGEGTVHEVASDRRLVAKVYIRAVDSEKAAKLRVMTQLGTPRISSFAAWPSATLHEGVSGATIGLLMPKVENHAEIHRLYNPRQRLAEYPSVDWTGLVRVAHNVSAAFEAVHADGHVIGDVNQGNVVVSREGLVRLIDCDSFQVKGSDKLYLCEVGVGHFTPPELQGRSFDVIVRTQQHDSFGLALLIFHLLFLGRHPYMGLYPGKDMELEEAIREHRFAFGDEAGKWRLSPPPHSLRLADASRGIARLFESAFSPESARTGHGRPTASEWVTALKSLEAETRACNAVKGHKFHQSLTLCPWCAIEAQGGPMFFLGAVLAATGGRFDVDAIWREILALREPDITIPLEGTTGLPAAGRPIARWVRIKAAGARVTGPLGFLCGVASVFAQSQPLFFAALVLLVLCIALRSINELPAERRRRDSILQAAESALASAESQLESRLKSAQERFRKQRELAEQERARYSALASERMRLLAALRSERELNQKRRHLERYYISRARLQGIGANLVAALQSFGIETAADVTRTKVMAVPGIGGVKANTLVHWHLGCLASFVFDPNQQIDATDAQRIEAQIARRRDELETVLRATPHELRRLSAQCEHARRGALPELARLRAAAQAARSDLQCA